MIRWLLLLSLLVAGCGMGPQAYPGDKTEERACRWCDGTGKDVPQEEGIPVPTGGKCPGCRGAKRLRVVIPGPNHPAVVKGTVRDAAALGNVAYDPEAQAVLAFEESRGPGPVRGAVQNAKILFEGPARVEYSVPASGRIKTMLKPGSYKATVTAPGYQETTLELTVRPRQEPLWAERARLITEEQEADTTYVDFLLKR